jgi:hypothetical protein
MTPKPHLITLIQISVTMPSADDIMGNEEVITISITEDPHQIQPLNFYDI